MIRTTISLVAVASFVALVACGDDEDAERYPSVESFCSALAAEECKAVAASCQATEQACTTERTQVCQAESATKSGGGRAYRSGAVDNCLGKTRELLAGRVIDPVKEKETTEACERVFGGSKERNAPCATDFECSGTLVCDKGVCAEKTTRNVNDGCSNAGEVCATGSYCGLREPGAQLRFCLPKKKVSEACSAETPCLEDLRCAGSATSGACQTKLAIGQGCEKSEDCPTGTSCISVNNAKTCVATSLPQGRTCRDSYGGT